MLYPAYNVAGRRTTIAIPYAQPGGTGDYYTQPNADANDPAGQYPMSWYMLVYVTGAPAADCVIFCKNNGITNVNGWRFVLTTGLVLTARCGDSVQRTSSTKTLTAGLWYIVHATVAASGNLRLYIRGTVNGSPTAVGATYATNTSNTAIFNTGNNTVPTGNVVRFSGGGVTYVEMTSGQVATHAAAIEAAGKCSAPGLSGSEWNWSAEDAGATWDDEIQAAQMDRTAAVGFTYSTDSSPSWGS